MSQQKSDEESSSDATMTDQAALHLDEVLQEYLQAGVDQSKVLQEEIARKHSGIADHLCSLFGIVDQLEALRLERRESSSINRFPDFIVPLQLGDFQILREVGRGGMGIVYEARQLSLDRQVALKILPRKSSHSREVERFRREAKIAASLHHSNVVPIFSYGENEGYYYFAMQLIQGHSLRDVMKGKWGNFREITAHWIASVGVQVAEALNYAHQNQTLHRDIKPSNLLLDQNGRVWISDFGVACAFPQDNDELIGQSGTVLYQAPERFSGACDIRSEVYSLGATLCALAGIRLSAQEGSTRIADGESRSTCPIPRSLPLPADLAAILLRATDPDPELRYQTASEMAADLSHYLENRPVQARKISWIGCLGKWANRNPLLAMALLMIALLMTLTSGILFASQLKFRNLNQELVRANDALVAHNRSLTRASFAVDAFVRSAMARVDTTESDIDFDVDLEQAVNLPGRKHWIRQKSTFNELLERLSNPKLQLESHVGESDERDGLLVISAAQRIGNVMYSLGYLNEAKAAAIYSLDIIKRAEADPSQRGSELALIKSQVLNDLADIQENRLNFDKADFYQRQALDEIGKAADLRGLDQYTQELGRIHYGLHHRMRDRTSSLYLLEQFLLSYGEKIRLPERMLDSQATSHRIQLSKYLTAETYRSERNPAFLLLSGQCLQERTVDQRSTPLDRERDFKLAIHFLEKAVVASQWNPRYVYHFAKGLASVPLFGWANDEFDSEIAGPNLELAYQLLRGLVRDTQESSELLVTLAECQFKLGLLFSLSSNKTNAFQHFQSSIKSLDLVLDNSSDKAVSYLQLRKAIYLIAFSRSHHRAGDIAQAEEFMKQAWQILQENSETSEKELLQQTLDLLNQLSATDESSLNP